MCPPTSLTLPGQAASTDAVTSIFSVHTPALRSIDSPLSSLTCELIWLNSSANMTASYCKSSTLPLWVALAFILATADIERTGANLDASCGSTWMPSSEAQKPLVLRLAERDLSCTLEGKFQLVKPAAVIDAIDQVSLPLLLTEKQVHSMLLHCRSTRYMTDVDHIMIRA